MRLASVSDLRTSMGFDDIPDVTNAIAFALDTTTPAFEAHLRTAFDRAGVTDTFAVGDQVWLHGTPQLRLRLSRGFVVSGSLTAWYADRIESLDDSAERTEVTGDLTLGLEKGVASNFTLDLNRKYLRVAYQAGFTADGDDPEMYDQAQVPDWLRTAAMLAARIELNNHPHFKSDEGTTSVAVLERRLSLLIGDKARFVPAAIDPILVA